MKNTHKHTTIPDKAGPIPGKFSDKFDTTSKLKSISKLKPSKHMITQKPNTAIKPAFIPNKQRGH
jgi:hypothetical protein